LKHLPVERLKIDRTFVVGLIAESAGGGGMDRGIVRAILAIAESAGMSVLAEGIETEDQREVLLELGCGQGQGYLFARPLPARSATLLLTESAAGLPIRAGRPAAAPVPAPRTARGRALDDVAVRPVGGPEARTG
jgi:EAL domain-containing protein (putative c-di-GMP-specific phosphodiesterase class I)